MKLVKAIKLLISTADKHPFLSPQSVPIRAYFLNIEIMLVPALDVLINSDSATGTITGYFGAVRLVRMEQAAAASNEYGGHQQDNNQNYCVEIDQLSRFFTSRLWTQADSIPAP